jgi:hypothetical protein
MIIYNNYILTICKDRPVPFTYFLCFRAVRDDGRFGQSKHVAVV